MINDNNDNNANKWYIHNPEFVLENKTDKIL